MTNVLDYMLKNNDDLNMSLAFILIGSYVFFVKINKINFFFFAIFIAVKFTTSNYVDNYINSKRELKEFEESHFTKVKFFSSLIITIPFLIFAYIIGKRLPMTDE